MRPEDAPADATPPRLSSLAAALQNRCPVCGEGRLMAGFLKPHDACSACGQDFTRHAAGDGAVFIVMTFLCFAVMGLVVWLELVLAPPLWLQLGLATAVTLAAVWLLLPATKRFMIAQSVVMGAGVDQDRGVGRDGVDEEPDGAR